MSHRYTCERCGRSKTCTIAGCDGRCVKACVTCLRQKPAVVHLVPCDAPSVGRGQVRSRCGALVQDVPAGAVTCQACIDLDLQDEKDIAALGEPFDTEDYR